MKALLTLSFLCFSFVCSAQRFALLDRNFKSPILFTDSLTINQVSNNYFPVRVTDLDSLVANLNYMKGQLNSIQRSKLKSFNLSSGLSQVNVTTIPHAYGDAYDIKLKTNSNNIIAEFLISSNMDLNKKAIKKIDKFIYYIKNEKDLSIKHFEEYNPVMLDATIFIRNK